MRTKTNVLVKLAAALLCIGLVNLQALSVQAATLNKNAIIPQTEKELAGITSANIETYFQQQGSQFAGYSIPQNFDVYFPIGQGQWDTISVPQQWQSATELEIYYGKTVAQLVEEWSYTSRPNRGSSSPSPGQLSPLVALATIDKESAGITGSYKSSIVTGHPITLSWVMGYGFNDRMANCANNGDCDIDYNRSRATFYGGPGQQIAEGISALKRWSTNPEALNACTAGQWQTYRINNECLNLENSISYALYRYTPNFSGNQLFLNLFTAIKANFPNIPVSDPAVAANNDTTDYSLQTYSTRISLVGKKDSSVRAIYNGATVADIGSTSWTLTLDPSLGDVNYTLQYLTSAGNLVNQKKIRVIRNKAGDINSDSKVDILDLSVMANYWGQTDPTNPLANLNPDTDNEVNILDLSLLAANFK